MKLTIQNLRGIQSAEIDINGIALVAGQNGAGKSSIAQAAAAVMAATPTPVDGFLKKDAAALVHDGQKKGQASIDGAKIMFPTGNVSGEGPRGSAVAAGLAHPLDMAPADAAKYLSGLLSATPTREDLDAALPDLTDKQRDSVWKSITDSGWDGAFNRAKDKRAENKGAWQSITGQKWGAKLAENRLPPEFDGSLPEREALEAARDKAQAEYDKAVSSKAVSADWLERTQATADSLADWRDALSEAQTKLAEAETELEQKTDNLTAVERDLESARAKRAELPQPGAAEITASCPSCGTHLVVITQTELATTSGGPDETENKRRQDAIDVAEEEISGIIDEKYTAAGEKQAAQSAVTQQSDAVRIANERIAAAEQAAAELKDTPKTGASDEQIAEAAEHRDGALYRLSLLDTAERAAAAYRSVQRLEMIVAVLDPKGLRQDVLLQRLDDANATLAALSATAKYPAASIVRDDNGAIDYALGGRSYRLLSESEQFRVRVIMQIMIARIDGSALMVIDRADILDGPGRNGLFRVLKSVTVPALVCMTFSKREDVPALPESMGAAYWVENGTAQRA